MISSFIEWVNENNSYVNAKNDNFHGVILKLGDDLRRLMVLCNYVQISHAKRFNTLQIRVGQGSSSQKLENNKMKDVVLHLGHVYESVYMVVNGLENVSEHPETDISARASRTNEHLSKLSSVLNYIASSYFVEDQSYGRQIRQLSTEISEYLPKVSEMCSMHSGNANYKKLSNLKDKIRQAEMSSTSDAAFFKLGQKAIGALNIVVNIIMSGSYGDLQRSDVPKLLNLATDAVNKSRSREGKAVLLPLIKEIEDLIK